MTRKEETKQAADNYIGHPYEIEEDLDVTTARNSFILGAGWADKTMIEKACDFIKYERWKYDDSKEGTAQMIKDFHNAMEE